MQTLGDYEPGSLEGLRSEIKVKDEEINWYKYRVDCLNEENKRQAEQLAKHCGVPTTNSEMLEKLGKLEEENKSWMHKFQARVYDHRLEVEMFSRKQMGYQARELALKYINDKDEATLMLKDAVEQLKKELGLVKSGNSDGKPFFSLEVIGIGPEGYGQMAKGKKTKLLVEKDREIEHLKDKIFEMADGQKYYNSQYGGTRLASFNENDGWKALENGNKGKKKNPAQAAKN